MTKLSTPPNTTLAPHQRAYPARHSLWRVQHATANSLMDVVRPPHPGTAGNHWQRRRQQQTQRSESHKLNNYIQPCNAGERTDTDATGNLKTKTQRANNTLAFPETRNNTERPVKCYVPVVANRL